MPTKEKVHSDTQRLTTGDGFGIDAGTIHLALHMSRTERAAQYVQKITQEGKMTPERKEYIDNLVTSHQEIDHPYEDGY